MRVLYMYMYSTLVVLSGSMTNNYHITIIVGVRFIYQHIKERQSLFPMLLHLVQNKERLHQIQVRRSMQWCEHEFCVEPCTYMSHIIHAYIMSPSVQV